MKEWSPYQAKIFTTYSDTDHNITISAVPGAGKSTVLKQLCKMTAPDLDSIFLAFNKSIVEELKTSLPSRVEVSTLHGLGCRSLFSHFGNVKIESNKTFKFLKKLVKSWDMDKVEQKENHYLFLISDLYNLYRLNLCKDMEELKLAAIKQGLAFNKLMLVHTEELIVKITKYNKRRVHKQFEIDFADMIYLPVVLNVRVKKYDRVFIDESQDLNRCQHSLVDMITKRTGRFVAVGDEKQCIYSFLGADPESFEMFIKKPNTVKLPLSITYRCGKKIVDKVNTVFEGVEAFPGASDGVVDEDASMEDVEEGDMVLCRNNAPLAEAYLSLVERHQKCYIKGSDIGKNILKMISPYRHYTTETCLGHLYDELDKIAVKLAEQGNPNPQAHPSYTKYSDNIHVLKIVFHEFDRVDECIHIIEDMFKDHGSGTVLSTIHKSKGLENSRVFIVEPDLLPSKWAKEDWEIQQERNLMYVAYSRAKDKLGFIHKIN